MVINSSILEKIKEIATNEENVGHSIANVILENLNNITNIKIIDMAKLAFTSPSAINRFCKQIGLDGFSELKYELKIFSNSSERDNSIIKDAYLENIDAFIDQYLDIKINNALLLKKVITKKLLNDITKLVLTSKSLFLFATNLAYNVSKNFVSRLRKSNINIIKENDSNLIKEYMNLINENSTVIMITLSGQNEMIINLAKLIKTKNAKIIVISQNLKHFQDVATIEIPLVRDEEKIWDLYSIRAQMLMQILDFIYFAIINSK